MSFGDVRSLLHRPPDAAVWASLCAALEEFEGHQLDEQVLPYVSHALQSWPDALRMAPQGWGERLVRDGQTRLWRLARGLVAQSWGGDADRVFAALWADPEAPLTVLNLNHMSMWREGMEPWTSEDGEVEAPDEEEATFWAELRAWPGCARLQALHIASTQATDDLLAGFLLDATLPALTELELGDVSAYSSTVLNASVLLALAQSPLREQLTTLRVRGGHLSAQHLTTLTGTGPFPAVHTLDLRDNPLNTLPSPMTRRGVWPALRHLNLSKCSLSGDAVARLARAPFATQLETLDLSQNWIGDEGAHALRDNAHRLIALRHLDLTRSPIGLDAMTELIEALSQLDVLTIHKNQFSWANTSYLEDICEDMSTRLALYLPPPNPHRDDWEDEVFGVVEETW